MPSLSLPAARAIALAIAVLAAQAVRAAGECDVPAEAWQPRSAVHALAQRNGWHIDRLKIDDGCYEIKGLDAAGRRFKAKLDPATLEVVRMKLERGDHERERERERKHSALPAVPAVAESVARSDAG